MVQVTPNANGNFPFRQIRYEAFLLTPAAATSR